MGRKKKKTADVTGKYDVAGPGSLKKKRWKAKGRHERQGNSDGRKEGKAGTHSVRRRDQDYNVRSRESDTYREYRNATLGTWRSACTKYPNNTCCPLFSSLFVFLSFRCSLP